jgi:hypothetical protein
MGLVTIRQHAKPESVAFTTEQQRQSGLRSILHQVVLVI